MKGTQLFNASALVYYHWRRSNLYRQPYSVARDLGYTPLEADQIADAIAKEK